MRPYRSAGRVKALLFILGIVIILGALLYTNSLVNRMRNESREFLNFYADVYAKAASDFQGEDYSFVFEQIIQRITFPIIISSNPDGNPTMWKNVGIPGDSTGSAVINKVTARMEKMDESHKPIPLTYDDIVLGYIHYGDSQLIRELRWLPYVEILVVALFILIGYTGYQTIRRSEQRLIWIGMARETAHQLGTPISSLLGWIELMEEQDLPEKTRQITGQMRQDVHRLEQIAARFSQISSAPDLEPIPLGEVISEVVRYIKRRLPRSGKSVQLNVEGATDQVILLNQELLGWTLENLIKNGVDAIENQSGTITIRCEARDDDIFIDVIDTGRGIPGGSDRSNVFKPGYSTKKRGWGLGLSLAKRIVEEYHKGKLEVAESTPGKGTTMRITLNRRKLEELRPENK